MYPRMMAAIVSTLLMVASAQAAQPAAPATASAAPGVVERFGLEEDTTPVAQRPGWRKPKRVLIGYSGPLVDELRKSIPDVEIVTFDPARGGQQAEGVDALIGVCNAQLLQSGTSIRWVQLLTAGVENCVGLPAIRERKVLVTNMRRIGGPIIAEHAIALTLAFTRGLDLYIPAQARAEWKRVTPPGRMTVVQGKTMLVVGLGGIGTEVAERAHALGMKVIATRASSRSGPSYVSYVGAPEELSKLAAQADFVVNTVPLTEQTKGIFDAKFFEHMKPTAYFINVARGGSVDTQALLAALNAGKIAGAGLDVTDPEPLPHDHPLWKAPNLIITPHVANDSDLGREAVLEVVKENLRRYSSGDRMLSVVDVTRGY